MSIEDLRIQLDEITSRKDNHTMQPVLVAAIDGCSVRAVPHGDPRWPVGEIFECFEYAFGLVDSADYRTLTEIMTPELNQFGADAAFVHYLIQRNVLHEIAQRDTADDDLVLYFDNAGTRRPGIGPGLRSWTTRRRRKALECDDRKSMPAISGETERKTPR